LQIYFNFNTFTRNFTQNHIQMKKYVLLSLVIVGFFITDSCKKDNGPACAEIIVQDKQGNPISGANVRLHQDKLQEDSTDENAPVLDQDLLDKGKGKTNGQGKVTFCYEQEAIWELEVTHTNYQTDDDFVRLEQNETISKIISLKTK